MSDSATTGTGRDKPGVPGEVTLRRVGPDDWELWRALRLAALAEAPGAFSSRLQDWQGPGDREDRWRRRMSGPGVHLVALLRGRPSGMASGVPSDVPGVVDLISMWVDPRARGRGVGSALVAEVHSWAVSVGASTLRLDVAEGNEAAAALYRRHGFQDDGLPPRPMPDGVRRERTMVLHLVD